MIQGSPQIPPCAQTLWKASSRRKMWRPNGSQDPPPSPSRSTERSSRSEPSCGCSGPGYESTGPARGEGGEGWGIVDSGRSFSGAKLEFSRANILPANAN